MCGVGLHVSVEEDEIVDGASHGEGHDGDPHGMYHVALDSPVDEDAVSDQIVVVKVSTCKTERQRLDNLKWSFFPAQVLIWLITHTHIHAHIHTKHTQKHAHIRTQTHTPELIGMVFPRKKWPTLQVLLS